MINSNDRIVNLDLIRALAIILVLYYHLTQMLAGNLFTDKTLFYFGHHGVTIFFVLSGFLIGGIYYKRPNIKPFKFWLSRFIRTYPPYFIMLLVSWLSVHLIRKESFDFGYLFLIQNFYKEIPYFLVSWSLAVEEQFYLIFALLILAVNQKNIQLYFWCTCFLIPPVLRYFFYTEQGEFGFYKTASFLHIDSLATGVILAYFVHTKKLRLNISIWWTGLLFASIICIFYLISKYENNYTWSIGHTLANIAIGGWLISIYYAKTINIAKLRFVKLTAIMAYSLYLVHPLVIHFSLLIFKKISIQNLFVKYMIALALIYIVSYVFYVLIEKKSIDIRNKILKYL